jgi:hypothetical protein
MNQLKRKKQRKGAILALMVMVVLLLSMTSLALIRVGTEARLRTVRNAAQIAARFAADAGVERVLYLMNNELEAGAWTLDDVPTYSDQSLAAANADYTVTYTGDLSGGYTITSVGHSGNQTKTVRATVALTSLFSDDFAILTRGSLIIKNNSNIYGYNSADLSETGVPVSIGTLSIQDGTVIIGNNGTIAGDIYVGPEGSPGDVVQLGRHTDVAGEMFVMPQEYFLPAIAPPDYVASKGAISGKNVTLTASDSGKYTGITISNNGKLKIDGNVTLYVTGDIELNNNVEMEIDSDASLKLYFDGDITMKNNAGINNLSQIPAKAVLFGTGENQTIEIKNSNDLYSAIYAPNADVEVFNKIDIYGSIIVGSVDFKNSADIYYDKALKNVSLSDEGIRFSITRWEEL